MQPIGIYRIKPNALHAQKLRDAVTVLNITLPKDATALQMAVAVTGYTLGNVPKEDIEICDCCNVISSVDTFPSECPGCGHLKSRGKMKPDAITRSRRLPRFSVYGFPRSPWEVAESVIFLLPEQKLRELRNRINEIIEAKQKGKHNVP